jgi:hypothetical protein
MNEYVLRGDSAAWWPVADSTNTEIQLRQMTSRAKPEEHIKQRDKALELI